MNPKVIIFSLLCSTALWAAQCCAQTADSVNDQDAYAAVLKASGCGIKKSKSEQSACMKDPSMAPLMTAVKAGNCGDLKVQQEMNICAAALYWVSDAKLNLIYTKIRTGMQDKQNIKEFKDAELSWLNFRNSSCKFETANTVGGSVHPMVLFECLRNKTEARIHELHALTTCPEGDLACSPAAGYLSKSK